MYTLRDTKKTGRYNSPPDQHKLFLSENYYLVVFFINQRTKQRQ